MTPPPPFFTASNTAKNSSTVSGGCKSSLLKIFLLYRKPWITQATGIQNVSLPSSDCQATSDVEAKFSIPGLPSSFSRWPFLYNDSDTSKGRHEIKSPAV